MLRWRFQAELSREQGSRRQLDARGVVEHTPAAAPGDVRRSGVTFRSYVLVPPFGLDGARGQTPVARSSARGSPYRLAVTYSFSLRVRNIRSQNPHRTRLWRRIRRRNLSSSYRMSRGPNDWGRIRVPSCPLGSGFPCRAIVPAHRGEFKTKWLSSRIHSWGVHLQWLEHLPMCSFLVRAHCRHN